ncbi:hypothetical protein ASD15_18500 [Massilia sp. Root351]|uniref:PEP-CTERM sorting domain-containing protein n=1 Tax=Massilia sp. Root351 TaxID=1736522 RepID=UPI00070E7669|nr:PEP-CTERM sorting domain-containing protein [Massilia sp. Root351]KQV79330.1 hypothetical protein ASD15_18500 [Massilia sp. Root351]
MKRLFLAALLAVCTALAHADIIFDNGLGQDFSPRSGYFSTALQQQRLYDDFSLAGTYDIGHVFFQMGLTEDPFFGSFTFTIYNDAGGGAIGGAIYTRTLNVGDYTAVPNSIISYPFSTFYDVTFATDGLTLGAGNYLLSFYGLDLEFRTANTDAPNGYLLWQQEDTGDVFAIDGGLPFRLDGSVPSSTVPEPSSLLLSAAALAALTFHRRRRQH